MSIKVETELQSEIKQAISAGDANSSVTDPQHRCVDFLKVTRPLDIKPDGLSVIEKNYRAKWRWGLGPRTTLKFSLTRPQSLILKLSFESPFEDQSIIVKHDGVALATLDQRRVENEVAIQGTAQNTITLEYTRWNKPPRLFPNDNRQLAAQFSVLALVSADGAPLSFPSFEAPSFPYLGSPIENEDLARREYAEGKTVLHSLPPVVTLALTTRCNIQQPCLICDINTRPASADSSIEALTLERARPLIATARDLLIHCGGEPMFSKYFDQVIEMTSPATTISFATNAMLLTPKRADHMLKQGHVEFVVSMDAATDAMYRIMRPSFDFERVTRNIKYYTSKARELKKDNPGVSLNMTICPTNLEEVPAFVDLANEVGANHVSYNHLNPGLTHIVKTPDGKEWDYVKESTFPDPARHDELLLRAWERANKTGISMTFSGRAFIGPNAEKLEEEAQSMTIIPFLKGGDEEWKSKFHARLDPLLPPCFKPWQETVIQPTGDVRICYYHDQGEYTIGNIVDGDFFRLWNAEEMVAAREFFLAQGVAPRCKVSQLCQRCRR